MKAVHRDARDVQRICCVTLAITRVPRHRWIIIIILTFMNFDVNMN